MYIYIYIYLSLSLCVCACVYIYIYMCVCVQISKYMFSHTNICIYIFLNRLLLKFALLVHALASEPATARTARRLITSTLSSPNCSEQELLALPESSQKLPVASNLRLTVVLLGIPFLWIKGLRLCFALAVATRTLQLQGVGEGEVVVLCTLLGTKVLEVSESDRP